MDEIRTKLEDEANAVLNTMKQLSPDSDKYEKCVDRLTSLHDMIQAEKRIEQDFQDKEARREMEDRHRTDEADAAYIARKDENEEKAKMLKFQIISLIVGTGTTIGLAVLSHKFTDRWVKNSFVFEQQEGGGLVSPTGRGIWNSIFKSFKR